MIRVLDLLFALVATMALFPVILLVAAAIWLEDRGPVFFRQVRIGKDGRHFRILKFRSMTVAASTSANSSGSAEVADKLAARRRFQTTVPNDPRITRIGRVLRSSHLDELPQLLNVLRGEMSLVGVRPDTPSQEADYEPSYWIERHKLRPGITGPAQLHSNAIDLNGRTALEQAWLNSPTVKSYLRILSCTVAKVIGRSSY